jgi:prolipoprotein diacylglyceryltransferase
MSPKITFLIFIFKIWQGGLAIHGAIIAGTLTLIFYCHPELIEESLQI